MRMVFKGLGVSAVLVLGSASLGCDDGGTSFEGCGSDADCKGERICDDGMCVDPGGGTGGGSGSGGDAGASSGGSGGNNSGPIDDPELEAACMDDCAAREEAGCEMPGISLDQCRGQCLIIDEINRGYCLDEQRARYACMARGGYTCINGYPQPQATCIEEAQALSECSVDIPCRDFCDTTSGGCKADEATCLTRCLEQIDTLQTTYCGTDYNILLNCWVQSGDAFACDGRRPEVGECGAAVARVADCVSRRGESCDGFCWAADALGCGDGCMADCTAKVEDASCGYWYESLIECAVERSDLQLTCSGGEPEPTTDCDTYREQYETCMANSV